MNIKENCKILKLSYIFFRSPAVSSALITLLLYFSNIFIALLLFLYIAVFIFIKYNNKQVNIIVVMTTIVYLMYKERNITPPKEIAGALLSGILSDTLILQSPTATPKDVEAVE